MIRGQDETRGRIERERVVRLATIGGRGRAHVVPGVFAVDGDVFCSPTDAGQGRSWPGGCAIWTGTSGPRSWPASTRRTGRRCGGSGCAAPAGESPERTQWLGKFVERTAARESARNAAVGGKCGKPRCLLDHAGSCFRIRAPPLLGFFTRDRGTRRHATRPVVHAVRRRDCRSPRCPEAGAGVHAGSGAVPAGRAGDAEGRPVGDRSLLRLAGGRRRGMAACAAAVAVCAGPRRARSRRGQRRDWLSERRHDNRRRGAGRGLVGLEHKRCARSSCWGSSSRRPCPCWPSHGRHFSRVGRQPVLSGLCMPTWRRALPHCGLCPWRGQ